MPTTPPPRTLADVLRAWSDEELLALLRARPDLGTPTPPDTGQIASRAATRASVLRALDQLTRLELATLDALVVLGPAPRSDVVAVVRADPAAASAALDRLCTLALAWESGGQHRALTAVADALRGDTSAGVSGLRPVLPHAQSRSSAEAAIATLSPAARALLTHVVDSGGEGTTGRARTPRTAAKATSPAEELLAHGLLVPTSSGTSSGTVHVPGQVGLALRGATTVEAVDERASVATTERDPALVDKVAAGAAFEAVRRVELLLDAWGTHPPTVLRSGGLSVRDHKALTVDLHVTAAEASLLVEVALAAGLLAEGLDADGVPSWLPTHAFDTWADSAPEQRWWTLVRAWWDSARLSALAGTKDATGKTRNALAPDLNSAFAVEARHAALEVLAELPPGYALSTGTGLPSLVGEVEWRRPRRPRSRADMVAWAVAEAAVLGLTGLDGLSSYGRLFVGGDSDAALAALGHLLPSPVDHVLLQADLTAVAPGPLDAEVARTLHLLADVESRGGATVYRFTPTSVRRALDAGWAGGEIHNFLAATSRTPVPQPLTYLVSDVVRTFGTLRVGHAEAFLRAEDEQALDELMHHPRAAALELRRIAPTVVISSLPMDLLLPGLRELGAAPVVEAPDGTVRVARPDLQRARTPKPPPSPAVAAARETARLAAVLTAVRAGDRAASSAAARPTTATTPVTALALLREAIEAGATVLIGYVDNHGTTTERLVDPRRLEGGQLQAYDHRSDDLKTFSVHRITAVSRVTA